MGNTATPDRSTDHAIAEQRRALQAAGVVCIDRHQPQGMPEALRRLLHEIAPDVAVAVVGRGIEAVCVPTSWSAPVRLAAWKTLGRTLQDGTDGWNHADGLFWDGYELDDAGADVPEPGGVKCPSWCRRDHRGDDIRLGFHHNGEEEIRLLDVAAGATLRRRFRLTQFVDLEASDEPLVEVGEDVYDEPALRAMADTFLTWADRLRRAWDEAADQADVPAVAEGSR